MHFSFYRINADYCDFLRQADSHVPYTMRDKSVRPFVGIVFALNEYHYYAPLTSPKSKHLHMKNQIDFLKINGGVWGAINFNNMIPVHNACLHKVIIKAFPSDTQAETAYKNLLSNQLSWCNSHKDIITAHAQKLYSIITQGNGRKELTARCCNFAIAESQYLSYCQIHHLPISPPCQSSW